MHHRGLQIALLTTASLLASGCYCPMLSGRYCDCRGFPPMAPANCAGLDGNNGDCATGGPRHCSGLSTLFLGLMGGIGSGNNNVPSQQGPDYVSPQPKFHPVPTRPVFEPLPGYPPPQLIEPGTSNPLRSTTATIATARAPGLR
jgi:hypothetical protein